MGRRLTWRAYLAGIQHKCRALQAYLAGIHAGDGRQLDIALSDLQALGLVYAVALTQLPALLVLHRAEHPEGPVLACMAHPSSVLKSLKGPVLACRAHSSSVLKSLKGPVPICGQNDGAEHPEAPSWPAGMTFLGEKIPERPCLDLQAQVPGREGFACKRHSDLSKVQDQDVSVCPGQGSR